MNEMEKPKLSFFKRVGNIIVAPKRTMDDLKERPRILFPFVLISITYLLYLVIHFSLYNEYMLEAAKRSQQVMYEYAGVTYTQEALEQLAKVQSITGLVTAPIGAVIGWIIGAAILFGTVKIFRGEGRFKQYLSVTGYAHVILALYTLIKIIVTFFSGTLYLDTPLVSLGALFGGGSRQGFLYAVACGIDLYSIWFYCVIAVGVATVSGLGKKKSYIIMAVLFVLTLLFSGISASLAGSFM